MSANYLKNVVRLQKKGEPVGIYSACTANPLALEACLREAKRTGTVLLIEATANQVDQYGGYTGMTPSGFVRFVHGLAEQTGLAKDRIILGGDHLGPLTFAAKEEKDAMAEASELIRQYVLAGFTKIHIDTSMKVASDDPETRLSDEVIARRGAALAEVSEKAYAERLSQDPAAVHPVYIVGSEVPIPGGSTSARETGVQVTKPADFRATVAAFRQAFLAKGLEEAWNEIIGVVVQPGVEENDAGCIEYDHDKAAELMAAIKDYPGLVYEGHSTDYQTRYKLREMVTDGVGILKVGPGLTYALREALFALAFAEEQLYAGQPEKQSRLISVLDQAMLADPRYYQKHYHGTPEEIAFRRRFSYSDRCRYYLPLPAVQAAQARLLANFPNGLPLTLLSQFMPVQYRKVREGALANEPKALILDHIAETVSDYLYASSQQNLG